MSYPIQKAGSASDVISKNQIQTQYANILSQQLAVEAGIQGKVTYVSGGAGASSTLFAASQGNTIFTIAELRTVVANIISNTATTEAQAAALASAANRKLGIIVIPAVIFIDEFNPVIKLLLETNTLNTGSTSATLSVTNTVPITFGTYAGKLSGSFPGSILSYLSIPFSTIASGSFSVSYWFNPFDGGYYDPWSLSLAGTSGNDWGIQTDLNPAGTQSYNVRMSGLTTPTFTFTPSFGGWNYITVTISNTSPYQFKAYLNGVLQGGTATGTGPFNSAYGQYLFIGREGGNTRTYKGYIRQFMVHDFVLSQAQITSLYTQA